MFRMGDKVVRRIIKSVPGAPSAIGPYNPAVQVNNTLYISGQIGIDPKTGELAPGGVKPETTQALKNMEALLKSAGIDFNNVVKTTVLMADMKDYAEVNTIYSQFFTQNYPARAAYQVAGLPKGAQIEIEAVAVVGEIQDE